jgi:hypothetical protein
MLRRMILMLTLAAIAAVVVVPAAQSKTVTCQPGKVCKGTDVSDLIIGSPENDNIRAFNGADYVFANGGNDVVAHSGGADWIFGGCGSDTLRGGFGLDRVFANMPSGLYPVGTTCVNITAALTAAQITALENAILAQTMRDVADDVRDLVDCAYLDTRGDPLSDVGYGRDSRDVVVDCSNRDDQ